MTQETRAATTPSAYRVLVTSSRTWDDETTLTRALDDVRATHPNLVIVDGACVRGGDEITHRWCAQHCIPEERYPADWKREGRSAGPLRNIRMVATQPAEVLAFIRNNSHGASGCARAAERALIPVRRWTS
jgi:hypothetical protein